MEKHKEKQSELWMVFVDLEKAFDRVPHDLIWWSLRMKGADEAEIKMIQDMYKVAVTYIRTPCGSTDEFPVKVGVHQGSSLSPLLFIIVLDAITEDLS